MAVDEVAPHPRRLEPVFAEREDDVALLVREGATHQPVGMHDPPGAIAERLVGAHVVLEEVESPVGERLRVLRLVSEAAGVARAGPWARRGVDAGLEPEGMDAVGHRLHVREAAVGGDGAVREARRPHEVILLARPVGLGAVVLPAVVDVDVAPAVVGKAARDERLRGGDDVRGGDIVAERVPRVPAKRRREADRVADLQRQRALGCALRILRGEDDLVVAALGNRTGEDLRRRIETQPFGEVLRRELHRPLAGDWQAVDDGMSGPDAVDRRTVDARGGTWLRGEDAELPRRDGAHVAGRILAVLVDEVEVEPVAVVAVDAVPAVQHLEGEFLRASEVDREVPLALLAADGARVGYDLAVEENLELGKSVKPPVVHGIVDVETMRPFAELDGEMGVRVHAEVHQMPAVDAFIVHAHDAAVEFGAHPDLAAFAGLVGKVELGDGDLLAGDGGDDRCRERGGCKRFSLH